jgi:hypothetical protein
MATHMPQTAPGPVVAWRYRASSRLASAPEFVDTETQSRLPVLLLRRRSRCDAILATNAANAVRHPATQPPPALFFFAQQQRQDPDSDRTATRQLDDLKLPPQRAAGCAPLRSPPPQTRLDLGNRLRTRHPRTAGEHGFAAREDAREYCTAGWELYVGKFESRSVKTNLPIRSTVELPRRRVAAHPRPCLRVRPPPAGEGISRWWSESVPSTGEVSRPVREEPQDEEADAALGRQNTTAAQNVSWR